MPATTSKRLDGKVAIVTGAASGIGRAIALAFAQASAAAVIAADLDMAGLAETERLCPQGTIIVRRLDCSVAEDVEAMVAFAEQHFGRLDVICNNAGIVIDSALIDMTEEDWDRTIDVNLKGAFLGSKYAIPAMQRCGGGSIINLGSVNSFSGEALHSAYCASKGGVTLLTKCAALEYAKDKIRSNALCPGWIDTPMNQEFSDKIGTREEVEAMLKQVQPLGMGRPEQVAAAALFLACDDSSLVTGTTITVDGGLTCQLPFFPAQN